MNSSIVLSRVAPCALATLTCFVVPNAAQARTTGGMLGATAVSRGVTQLIPISSPADFDLMRSNLGATFFLTNEIDLAGVVFEPIGDQGQPFTGKFSGAGFSILNLTINFCPVTSEETLAFGANDRVGFFGVTDGAVLNGIRLENVSVVGDEVVGGLVAQAQQTELKGCVVTGSVKGRIAVGGMVGFFGDSDADSCWTEVAVDICEPSLFPGKWHGGLIGHAHPYRFPGRDPSNVGDGSTMINCYTRGSTRGDYVAGGLVGNFHAASAENCFALGDVTTINSFSGGLLGYIQNEPGIGITPIPLITSLVDCAAHGDVVSEAFGSFPALQTLGIIDFGGQVSLPCNGGFVAYIEGGLDTQGTFPNVIIEACTAQGMVTTLEPNPAAKLPTGGFVGFTEIETHIAFCKSTGDVMAPNQTSLGGFIGWGEGVVEDCTSHGDVIARNRCGAFAGQCSAIRNAVTGDPGPFGGKFRRCESYGNVSATDPTPDSLVAVGGFVGYLFADVEITDCAALGSVTTIGGWAGGFVGHAAKNLFERCVSFGPVFTQDRNCGGFVGRTRLSSGTMIRDCVSHSDVIYTGPGGSSESQLGGFVGSAMVATSISNCFSTGTVVANGTTVGGFVGAPSLITFTDNYWDTQASQQTGTQPSGVNGRTTDLMRQELTFVGWDFATIWDIVENESYPSLR